jgi:hypothetical protein
MPFMMLFVVDNVLMYPPFIGDIHLNIKMMFLLLNYLSDSTSRLSYNIFVDYYPRRTSVQTIATEEDTDVFLQ